MFFVIFLAKVTVRSKWVKEKIYENFVVEKTEDKEFISEVKDLPIPKYQEKDEIVIKVTYSS